MMEDLFTRKQMENAVMLAADLYQGMYYSPATDGGALEVAGAIIDEAVKMEAWMTEKYGKDDDQYLDHLDEYETLLKKKYGLQKNEVTVIFGENAAQAYMNDGVDGLCEFIDEGQLVRMTFDTLAERRAYISGIDDADGWLGSAVLEDSDAESERVKALLDN